MSEGEREQHIDFTVDKNNLYREESLTDLKVASIRKLIPIKSDGTEDKSRTPLFFGHTQLMSPQGPVPIQAPLQANNFTEAIEEFPKAMKEALANVIENIKRLQEEEQAKKQQDDSRIIIPGR